MESNDQKNLYNMPDMLQNRLHLAFALMADFEDRFGPVSETNRGTYLQTLILSRKTRAALYHSSSHKVSTNESDVDGRRKHLLEEMYYIARLIRSIERLIHKRGNIYFLITTLKVSMQVVVEQRQLLVSEARRKKIFVS